MLKPTEHLATRLLTWLASQIVARRKWFIYPQILLAALCVFYTVKKLEFDMSRDNLVGGDKQYHQNFLRFKKEFPFQDDLVVVVESENKDKNRQFVERLGARLDKETNLFTDVVYKGDLSMLGRKALLFVPENDLKELQKTLVDYRPFLERFTQSTNLQSLFNLVNNQFLTAKREENADNDAMIKAMPALEHIINEAADAIHRGGSPPSPGLDALFSNGSDEAEGQMYITFAKGKIYLVTAKAASMDKNEDSVNKLRELVVLTQKEVHGVNVGITGEPVLEIDEMAQSQDDTTLATIISLVLVIIIFVYGYQETGRPFKATFCLIIGLAYTMAYTTFVVGHLNILTITFTPILIGLAIDFGVHLVSRYEEELRHGRTELEALNKAVVYTGLGVATGCFTTAGAFLAMMATNFKGIQEMGVICGGGLLICLIPMMTMLPAMLLTGRQNKIDHDLGAKLDRRERIERLWLARPRLVAFVTATLCISAAVPAWHTYFDYNLLNMQSAGLPAVVFSEKLINSANKSVLYGAVVADSLQDAVRLEQQLTNLYSVAQVDLGGIDNMAANLTEDQTAKLKLVAAIREAVESIQFQPYDTGSVNLPEFSKTLWILNGYLSSAISMTIKDEPKLAAQLKGLQSAVSNLRTELYRGDEKYVSQQLAAFQQALFSDISRTFETLRTQDASSRLTVNDLPQVLKNRFLGTTGKYLVQVYPKKDVWKRDNQKEFVEELRTVDSKVTGTPVQLLEYVTLLKNSYQDAALYSLFAIAFLVFLHFRSVICVVLALLPVFIGTLWMTGMMGLFDIPFNPANIMTLPLVIGVGVTNGIHILNRFAEERNPSILAKSTGKAVLVSGLTTIAGFGSLMIGKHQGISSLGFIMAVGTATCMLAALTFLPALLNLMAERGWGLGGRMKSETK